MPSDHELLEAWRNGDRVAGNALVERHFPAVYRFFRNKCSGDIEDLVQRTFLACVESRDRYRGESSFRTYLFAIARNELFARFRREGAGPEVELGSQSVADLEPRPSPTEALAKRDEQRILLRALRSLPLDDQIALELFYWEQLSGVELARVLGVPEGTARTRLRRARADLDARMNEVAAAGEALRTTTDQLDRWLASLREIVRAERRNGG